MADPRVPKAGIGPQPRIRMTFRTRVGNRQHQAQDHWGARVAGGAKSASQHEEDQHAAAEQEHDPEKRQRLALHRRRGVHQIQQPGRGEVANGSQHRERQEDGGKKCLIHHAVDFVRVSRPGEPRDQYAHSGKQRPDEDDHHQHDLPAHADGRVALIADQVPDQHVIDDPLKTSDDVGDHRGPGNLPDGPAERPFDNRAVVGTARR